MGYYRPQEIPMTTQNGSDGTITTPRTRTRDIPAVPRTKSDSYPPMGIGLAPVTILQHATVGLSPAGFYKIRAELPPPDLARLIGYDPRSLAPSKGKRPIPHNVERAVVDLQQSVQRSIDGGRVAQMVQYLRNALEHGDYADWAEIDVLTSNEPDIAEYEATGRVMLPVSSAFFIAD